MYQALHTTVICDGGSPLEVQIKTYELHEIAEYGVAAHWRYKEGRANDLRFEEKMAWLRQVLDWQREMAATDEFIESVKQDIFQDQVFVYTPKGDIVELTAGSTPIDFGYKIHTDLGHRCIGAKVNGRLVSLDTKLQNGDTVEVLASKLDRGPSLDWLNPNRGYVGSASARQKVRLWFRRQARSANIQRGRELLRRELRRLNQRLDDAEVLSLCNYDNMEDLLANLGSGGITEKPGWIPAGASPSGTIVAHSGRQTQAGPVQPGFRHLRVGCRGPFDSDGAVLQSHTRRLDYRLCDQGPGCYGPQAGNARTWRTRTNRSG